MLKHGDRDCHLQTYDPAAFRRLCVETLHAAHFNRMVNQPPSGGCVLKHYMPHTLTGWSTSRLQAAVC